MALPVEARRGLDHFVLANDLTAARINGGPKLITPSISPTQFPKIGAISELAWQPIMDVVAVLFGLDLPLIFSPTRS
jgi:hypothetical protein